MSAVPWLAKPRAAFSNAGRLKPPMPIATEGQPSRGAAAFRTWSGPLPHCHFRLMQTTLGAPCG